MIIDEEKSIIKEMGEEILKIKNHSMERKTQTTYFFPFIHFFFRLSQAQNTLYRNYMN